MMHDDAMVVGVVGTSNTGKTTFISDLVSSKENVSRDADMQWTIYGKDYRQLAAERGLPLNREANRDSQLLIHETMVQNVLDARHEKRLKRMVMDRTVLDSFAYTYWMYRYGSPDSGVTRDVVADMWKQVMMLSRMYDLILYIPMSLCGNIRVVEDGVRDTDYAYRCQMDDIFSAGYWTLHMSGANVRYMYGDRGQRVSRMFEIECGLEHGMDELCVFENHMPSKDAV